MKLHHHCAQDYQSLLMHQEAVRLLERAPALTGQLLETLSRWEAQQASERSKPLRDQWVRIIEQHDWALATEESERGNQLRQASPLATLLPTDARLAIIRQVRALKEQPYAQG